jgi:hypothetical protein
MNGRRTARSILVPDRRRSLPRLARRQRPPADRDQGDRARRAGVEPGALSLLRPQTRTCSSPTGPGRSASSPPTAAAR